MSSTDNGTANTADADALNAALPQPNWDYIPDRSPEGLRRWLGWRHGTIERIAGTTLRRSAQTYYKSKHRQARRRFGAAECPAYEAAYESALAGETPEPPKWYSPQRAGIRR